MPGDLNLRLPRSQEIGTLRLMAVQVPLLVPAAGMRHRIIGQRADVLANVSDRNMRELWLSYLCALTISSMFAKEVETLPLAPTRSTKVRRQL